MTLNQTSYLILGMLTLQPEASGYDIRKAVEGSVSYFWGESYGQIYPTLKRLAAEGLIEPAPAKPGPGKRRQAYAITPAGREQLKDWLALPFHNDPPRNEFLLKLFFAKEAAPGVAAEHVRELNRRNAAMLGMLEEIERQAQIPGHEHPHKPYWMMTLRLGVAMIRAALQWGEQTLGELEGESGAARK